MTGSLVAMNDARRRPFVPSPLSARAGVYSTAEQFARSDSGALWRALWMILALVLFTLSVTMLTGCAHVGAWRPARKSDGAACRSVRPLFGLLRGHDECRMRLGGDRIAPVFDRGLR